VARANLEIFLDSRGSVWKFVDCGLILQKGRGLFAKRQGFSGFGIIFEWKIRMDRVHGLWTAQGWPVHESVEDLAGADGPGSPELGLVTAPVHDSSP
jgi:hypothetical protein